MWGDEIAGEFKFDGHVARQGVIPRHVISLAGETQGGIYPGLTEGGCGGHVMSSYQDRLV